MSDNKPIEKIRVGGVQIAIWKNTSEKGPFYRATVELSYKSGDGWKTGSHFGMRDLVNLAKAALLAHSAIGKLSRADENSEGDDFGDEAAAA